ncbi:MAG: BspA family leucine-rich repeat surface protein, partial [Clostridia bacterium]|nr:BspA family leucine-rich repeat surface protein [Clostridia bacterium]
MISLNEFLVNNKINRKIDNYSYQPTSKIELIKNIEELINNGEYDLNCIDTSKITDMSNLFFNTDIINADIANINFDVSKWNVSNVKDMSYMFCQCVKFNCDLSNWDVSNVKDMSCMFSDCQYFNKPLNDWDVSNVKDMSGMFSF